MAYSSVPRSALWIMLDKLSVPQRMLELVKSLHGGMDACAHDGNGVTDPSLAMNGLGQGCTLAPTLFNLLFSSVANCSHPP